MKYGGKGKISRENPLSEKTLSEKIKEKIWDKKLLPLID